MGVWTKIVFPSVRIVIWAVIAAALFKIAFVSTEKVTQEVEGITPGGNFTASTFAVEKADIINNLEISAQVILNPVEETKAGTEGYLGFWAAQEGAEVVEGQAIAEIRKPIMSQQTEDEDGNVVEPQDTGLWTRTTLFAPISGTLHQALELKENVEKSTLVFTINPNTMSIQGDLSPQDRYRLIEEPDRAKIALEGGPAEFTCKNLSIGNDVVKVKTDDLDVATDGYSEDLAMGSSETTAVKVSCPAPKKVRLFPGLTGKMTIPAGKAKGVLAIPVTAVQGVMEKGKVWIVDPATGDESERDVKLGISDGSLIEVVEGLKEGESIREFAPGNIEEIREEGGES